MEKYFGNFVTTMSTLMVLAALGFVVYSAIKQRKSIFGVEELLCLLYSVLHCAVLLLQEIITIFLSSLHLTRQ